ncbi:hypothetical protein BGZ83_000006 [Gryganskiella cystojenkinii]|nr:hypothetical protein BGZ83_000006 [Gryganskiella cystojenkinii]
MPLVHQFFYLDLTSQWTNNIPVWAFLGSGNGKEIASDPGVGIGGPTLFSPSMAVSSDSNYLNTFGGMGALAFSYRYSFTTGVWSISQAKVLNKNQRMVQAAMDPSTNLVYFAGGFENATDVDNNLSVYSFQDDTLTNSLTIPTTIPEGAQFPVLTDRKYYSVVYSKSLQGFLYFGGFSNNNQKSPNPGVLTVYNPKTNTWSVPTTKGAGPAHRSNLCMASNDKTAEVVVFAGMLDYEQLAQDIWFLNTTDWSWTQGPNYTEPRAYHTCTISNNTFISWGGWNGRGPTDNTLVLFNLNTKNYTDVYTPPEGRMIPQNPGQPGGGLTNGGDGGLSSKQLAKIIGGSAAGLLILMAIAGACLYIYRRNKALRQQIENLGQDERDEDEDEEGEKTGESRYSDLASSRTSPSTMVLNRSGYRHQQVPSMFGLGSFRQFESILFEDFSAIAAESVTDEPRAAITASVTKHSSILVRPTDDGIESRARTTVQSDSYCHGYATVDATTSTTTSSWIGSSGHSATARTDSITEAVTSTSA